MLLTPLGIVAAGTAWGEWGARDFSDPHMRQQIAAASNDIAPPPEEPRGLARLSALWSAPFPQYAPPFVRRPRFWLRDVGRVWQRSHSRVLSTDRLDGRWTRRSPDFSMKREGKIREGWWSGVSHLLPMLLSTLSMPRNWRRRTGSCKASILWIKIVAILPLIFIAALARQLWVIAVLFAVATVVAMLSRVPLATLTKRVWLAVLAFTGFVFVPPLFLVPGRAIYVLPLLGWSVTAKDFALPRT